MKIKSTLNWQGALGMHLWKTWRGITKQQTDAVLSPVQPGMIIPWFYNLQATLYIDVHVQLYMDPCMIHRFLLPV